MSPNVLYLSVLVGLRQVPLFEAGAKSVYFLLAYRFLPSFSSELKTHRRTAEISHFFTSMCFLCVGQHPSAFVYL